MHIYIAGKLRREAEQQQLEAIDALCKSLGHTTFLPHRDAGLCTTMDDVLATFKKDIQEGMHSVNLIIACLDGLHVGAGTAWELGYAYAQGIPAVGLKTDEPVADALEYLSAILIGSMPIVTSLDELETWLQYHTKEK